MEGPRIVLLDCEISPALGYFYGKPYETDILSVKEEWYLMAICVKTLDEPPETKILPDHKGNEKKLVEWAHGKLEKADIVVGHNIDGFDKKKLNARFAHYGLPPPPPYKTVDTLKLARKHFAFTSNRLGDLADHLHTKHRKMKVTQELWQACIRGDERAWERMRRYNERDVIVLEEIYLKLRPWGTHPNMSVYLTKTVCPHCGSKKLQARGFNYTKTRKQRRFQCNDCHAWGQSTVSEDDKATVTS